MYAAAVIGDRFETALMIALGVEVAVDELTKGDLVDQVRLNPNAEYVFRHPLIHAVAYESQLKSHRAELHRRVAAAIEARDPASADQNAALIAEHLQAAGELAAAYGWHMRAAVWSSVRDIDAARVSWQRAIDVADRLSGGTGSQLEMRIAPRTMLCATDFQSGTASKAYGRFEELRVLCEAAGDKVSLAIGMTGLATELVYSGRSREGAQLAVEQMALLQSIGDPNLTMALAVIAFVNWADQGEFGEILRWSQTVIDLAAGDPTKGAGYGVGSPLAHALACRGHARWWLGRPGWRQDNDDAEAMARNRDPTTVGFVVAWAYGQAILFGVRCADDAAVRAAQEALHAARRAGNDHALGLAQLALGTTLLHRDTMADRDRGLEVMAQARELTREHAPFMVPFAELSIARERARRGDCDAVIPMMREALGGLRQAGRLTAVCWALGQLVEALLQRGAGDDLDEAAQLIHELAELSSGKGSAALDIYLLRLRALLARSAGDSALSDLVAGYCAMAETHGFEGHIQWADAMSAAAR